MDSGSPEKLLPPPELLSNPEDRRALGCRLGFVRHLLLTAEASRGRVARALREIPGLEAFLVDGVNRATRGLREPVERVEDVLQHWGYRRTESAVALFERRIFERRPRPPATGV